MGELVHGLLLANQTNEQRLLAHSLKRGTHMLISSLAPTSTKRGSPAKISTTRCLRKMTSSSNLKEDVKSKGEMERRVQAAGRQHGKG